MITSSQCQKSCYINQALLIFIKRKFICCKAVHIFDLLKLTCLNKVVISSASLNLWNLEIWISPSRIPKNCLFFQQNESFDFIGKGSWKNKVYWNQTLGYLRADKTNDDCWNLVKSNTNLKTLCLCQLSKLTKSDNVLKYRRIPWLCILYSQPVSTKINLLQYKFTKMKSIEWFASEKRLNCVRAYSQRLNRLSAENLFLFPTLRTSRS